MKLRKYWLEKIYNCWKSRPIIWLTGVRRVGKTVLARSLNGVEYFDCELKKTRFLFDDPFNFLKRLNENSTIIIDEIHKLEDPSALLKIAHDYFPRLKVLATGSSSLGVSDKFKDTLTGRKWEIWLTPMNWQDLSDFGNEDFIHRMLYGGLPANFCSAKIPELEFEEWMDSYWSREIQSLFRLERRSGFLKLVELFFVQSGSIFEASRFSAPCEVSRSTISNYLSVLEATHVIQVVRPFSSRKTAEIVSAPKTYAFDTGFICYFRGWNELHSSEIGQLWEHLILNELNSFFDSKQILYWRDKRGHEVDFVLAKRGKPPFAIECKWKAKDFESVNLRSFRNYYPGGRNYVVASDVENSFQKCYGNLEVSFINISQIKDIARN